jgi:hypothetical protein
VPVPDILTERRGILYVSENIWSWKGSGPTKAQVSDEKSLM